MPWKLMDDARLKATGITDHDRILFVVVGMDLTRSAFRTKTHDKTRGCHQDEVFIAI